MILLLTLIACGDGKDSDTGSMGTGTGTVATSGFGTLAVSFSLDTDYIGYMEEAPVGTIQASIYAGADVSAIGPNDGAVALADINLPDIDLQDGGPTAVLYTSASLAVGDVYILGCLDSDANDCDKSDMVTTPNANKFTVIGDAETPVTVEFDIMNPG